MVDDRKEVLPLRIVAARFINTDEKIGLAELDRITADASRAIQNRYWIWASSFMTTAAVTAGSVLVGGVLTIGEVPGADLVALIGLGGAGLMVAVGASWRVFQYGGMKARSPQDPAYADPVDRAVLNLERLFGCQRRLDSDPPRYVVPV